VRQKHARFRPACGHAEGYRGFQATPVGLRYRPGRFVRLPANSIEEVNWSNVPDNVAAMTAFRL